MILVACSYLMLIFELTLARIFKTALLRWVLIMMAHFMVLICRCCAVATWLLHECRWFWLLPRSNRLIFLSRRSRRITAVRIFKHLTFRYLVLIHLIDLLRRWLLLICLLRMLGLYLKHLSIFYMSRCSDNFATLKFKKLLLRCVICLLRMLLLLLHHKYLS